MIPQWCVWKFKSLNLLTGKRGNLFKGRSRQHRCFKRKVALRNFAKFTGKHLCCSLFLNKLADLRPANFIKYCFCKCCWDWNMKKCIEVYRSEYRSISSITKHDKCTKDSLPFCRRFSFNGVNITYHYQEILIVDFLQFLQALD